MHNIARRGRRCCQSTAEVHWERIYSLHGLMNMSAAHFQCFDHYYYYYELQLDSYPVVVVYKAITTPKHQSKYYSPTYVSGPAGKQFI
jgi:hypothetical protein